MLKFKIKFCTLKDEKVNQLKLLIIDLLSQDLKMMRKFLNIKCKQFDLELLLQIIFLLKILEFPKRFFNFKLYKNHLFFNLLKIIKDHTIQLFCFLAN